MDPAQDQELASLLALAQRGDRRAYQDFLLGVCAVLRPYLTRRTRDGALAEDVLQDTLLAVHRALRSHRPGLPVGPWLYAICDHRLTDAHRRRRRIARLEENHSAEAPAPASADIASQRHPAFDALGALPGKQRRIIELLKLHELSVREVAERVGMTESAVKVSAFRGYRAMRKKLGVERG